MTSRMDLYRSWIPLALAAILVSTGACDRTGSRTSERDPRPRPDLERALERLPAQGAMGLLWTEEGIWRSAYGEAKSGRHADPQDRFEIASITKTFVSAVVLQLVEEGRLSLDDSIEDVLPGALPYGRRITVRQLLNHSSGLYGMEVPGLQVPGLTPRKILEAIAETPPLSRPGAVHSYANINFVPSRDHRRRGDRPPAPAGRS